MEQTERKMHPKPPPPPFPERASPSGILSHSAVVNAREESGDMEKARRKRKRNWSSSSFSSSSPEFYRDLSKSDDDLDFI